MWWFIGGVVTGVVGLAAAFIRFIKDIDLTGSSR